MKLNDNILRVVRLDSAQTGQISAVLLHQRPNPESRVSKKFRPLARLIRSGVKAQAAFADAYLDRHDRANAKKKNGWAKNYGKNLFKAIKAGKKKVKWGQILDT
jgi:hypothetical protein